VSGRAEERHDYVEYVRARRPVLYRAAYLICGDAHRADDLVQNTLTTLFRKWRRAREADNLDAWVHRMLVRAYLSERRLSWYRVRLIAETPERGVMPASAVEDRDELMTALARLPRSQRTVLVLRFACDLSVEDVAAALRCSTSNVKSHTTRGLAALRHLLAVDHTQPGRSHVGG
jgi:RNA polymerase sigma-70 factor (sigma-E family)